MITSLLHPPVLAHKSPGEKMAKDLAGGNAEQAVCPASFLPQALDLKAKAEFAHT